MYLVQYSLMASQPYAVFSRAWSMAAVNVKVADSHQQSNTHTHTHTKKKKKKPVFFYFRE